MTNTERAAEHVTEAERLLAESSKHKVQAQRGNLAAWQAGVHATLALYYQREPDIAWH
jgi:hypothetical protein